MTENDRSESDISKIEHAPGSHHSVWRGVILYACMFLAFSAASALAPVSDSLIHRLLSAIVGALVALYFIYQIYDLKISIRQCGVVALMGIGVHVSFLHLADLPQVTTSSQQIAASCLIGVSNLGLLVGATGIGLVVALGMQDARYLVMAATVGGLTDIFSVYAGPSGVVLQTNQKQYMMYQWGLVSDGGVSGTVGMGDFIFLALYFRACRMFGLSEKRTLVAMAMAFTIGLLSFLLTVHVNMPGIPALPFMSISLLATHAPELRRLLRERHAMLQAAKSQSETATPHAGEAVVGTAESPVSPAEA